MPRYLWREEIWKYTEFYQYFLSTDLGIVEMLWCTVKIYVPGEVLGFAQNCLIIDWMIWWMLDLYE
jgi:hypothetical protein